MAEKSRIQNLFDSFDRLSTREKIMVGGLAGAFGVTLVVILWMVFSSQITALEQRNESARDTLAQVMTLKDTYLARKARNDAKKALLDNNRVGLVKLMEGEAQRQGFIIEEFKETKRSLADPAQRPRVSQGERKRKVKELFEVSQAVTIRKVSLEALANFLAALEKNESPIRVTKMSIDTSAADRQQLRQVKLTVSTYRNEEVEL